MTALHKLTPRARQRTWQIGFAVFSAIAAAILFPGENARLPELRLIGVVGYLVAAVVSLAGAVTIASDRAARFLIGFHLTFVPMQFVFSFPNPLPNLGLLMSVLILFGLRPRFPRFSPRVKKVWLTLHVGLSVGWLGLSLGMLTLAVTGLLADSHALRHSAYEIFHIFDRVLIIPTVLLSIITGVVSALGTQWGLIRHRWVLLKFVISLSTRSPRRSKASGSRNSPPVPRTPRPCPANSGYGSR